MDARRVVVATGYATTQFRPLAGRFRLYRTYVLATRPLSIADRRELGLGPVMIWDTARPYHYARWTADHRLLLGGADRPLRPGQRPGREFTLATGQLRGDFEALLPALARIEMSGAWEGLFAMTPDSLPYVGPHRLYPASASHRIFSRISLSPPHLDPAVAPRELHSVRQKIPEDLLQPVRIGGDGRVSSVRSPIFCRLRGCWWLWNRRALGG